MSDFLAEPAQAALKLGNIVSNLSTQVAAEVRTMAATTQGRRDTAASGTAAAVLVVAVFLFARATRRT